MTIIKSTSGKLLCLLSHHELITQVRPHKTAVDFFVEERKCSRCGFGFQTGKLIHNKTLQRNSA